MAAKTKSKTKASLVPAKASPKQTNAAMGPKSEVVERAVAALVKHVTKGKEGNDLLQEDATVQVQLSMQMAPMHSSPKPIRLQIPNALYQLAETDDAKSAGNTKNEKKKAAMELAQEAEVCLIVKEESKSWVQEMIANNSTQMGCIKKVLGLQSLRKKHAQYDQRRQLLSKYNFFMADDRILPMLTKHLGKDFFKAKKLPIPIKLTRKEALPFAVQRALAATFMSIPAGTCITIRAGHTGMDEQDIAANILAIVQGAADKIPRKWANVQAINIKTPDSVALPIYNKSPAALLEIAQMAGLQAIKPKQYKVLEQAKKSAAAAKKQQQSKKQSGTKHDTKDDTATPTPASTPTKKDKPQAAKKSKTELKSPLLKALKKQKQDQRDAQKEQKEKTTDKDVTSTPTKSKTSDESSKGKKRKSLDKKSPKKSPAAKQKDDNPTSGTPTSAKKQKSSDSDTKKKDFISAKKFKGSKSGYIFTLGKQGLGYYVDHKPVVNKMVLDALTRQSKQSRRGGARNNKKNKYKGTRRF